MARYSAKASPFGDERKRKGETHFRFREIPLPRRSLGDQHEAHALRSGTRGGLGGGLAGIGAEGATAAGARG